MTDDWWLLCLLTADYNLYRQAKILLRNPLDNMALHSKVVLLGRELRLEQRQYNCHLHLLCRYSTIHVLDVRLSLKFKWLFILDLDLKQVKHINIEYISLYYIVLVSQWYYAVFFEMLFYFLTDVDYMYLRICGCEVVSTGTVQLGAFLINFKGGEGLTNPW